MTALPPGTLLLSLALDGTWATTGHPEFCPDINPVGCAMMPVPTEWHDLALGFAELRLHAELRLTRWLAADLLWGVRLVSVHFTLEDAATRQPIVPPFGPEIHHRTETLIGSTDPWISLRAAKQLGPWAFLFRLGATLPVGNTVPNPFDLGRQGISHEHIQFGTGTVDPLAEVGLRRNLGHFTWSAFLLAKASLYANPHGYQAGSQLLAGTHLFSDLWTRRWTFALGALVYNEQPERWNGVEEAEGNLGRTDALLDTSIAVLLGQWSLALVARFPVYSHSVGEQLATPAIFELSLARPFALWHPKPSGPVER